MVIWLVSLLLGYISYNPLNHFLLQHEIVSPKTITWLDGIRSKYDIPGISLGAIASPLFTGNKWRNQTFHTGFLENGEPVDDNVSGRAQM